MHAMLNTDHVDSVCGARARAAYVACARRRAGARCQRRHGVGGGSGGSAKNKADNTSARRLHARLASNTAQS